MTACSEKAEFIHTEKMHYLDGISELKNTRQVPSFLSLFSGVSFNS